VHFVHAQHLNTHQHAILIPIGEFNLIQQPQYTPTTPKYNFPLPPQTLQIPQKFIELSLKTIKTPQQTLQLLQETESHEEEGEEEQNYFFPNHNHYTTQPIPLKPIKQETTIIATDVSSIKIGETNQGIICAIRGTIVWKQHNRYRYLRIGPFPLHITEENKKEIHYLLRHHSLETPTEPFYHSNLINTPIRLGNLLEHWIKTEISRASQSSIILWDGSLTAGTPSNPLRTVSQALEMARNHLNTILAFSKNTHLRFLNHQLTVQENLHSPYLLEINGFPTKTGPFSLLGKVYMTKLTQNGCSFRLDIDKETPNELRIEAVEKLLGNDTLYQSYPETLRLAHIYSTFTATEVIALQRFLTKYSGLKILNRPNMHRLLFGPFGHGPEA